MDRYKFLSLTGLSFLGTFFVSANNKQPVTQTDCNDPITPPVAEGPFYKNEKLNRINIAEHKTGVPVDYIIEVEDKDCKPIEGAIVDIWQCDAEGIYSDFKQENTLNETWLRGYQTTGKDGMCRFKSIFPGWYNGRITHVHAKVYLNDKNVLTTNFFFTKDIENRVYKNPLYPKGPNPTSIAEDIELRVDKNTLRHDTLLMDVTSEKNGNLTATYKIALA